MSFWNADGIGLTVGKGKLRPLMTIATAPGPDRSRPAYSIRCGTSADLDAIDALERASFEADRFERKTLRRLLGSASARTLLAERAGTALGYVLLLYRKGAKAARLYSVAVSPDARGKGVGSALVDAAAMDAIERGCDRLRLEVRTSNAAAARVYARLGFRAAGERPAFYSDGENALLMEKRLDLRTDDRL